MSNGQLKSLVERIERLEGEKKAIGQDIRDVYAEAKGNGFDVKIIRHVLKIKAMDEHQREEQEILIDTYMRELGLQGDMFHEHG